MSKDLEVKITTTYETKGKAEIAQQSDAIKKLKDETNSTTGASNKLASEQRKQIEIAQKLTMASRGSAEGIAGLAKELTKTGKEGEASIGKLSTAFQSLTAKLAAAGPVMAALYAGWAAGTAIFDNVISPIWNKIVQYIGRINPLIAKSKEEFDKLNQVRLDKLNKEFETLTKTVGESIVEIDRVAQRVNKLTDAKAELEVAKIERDMPAGPERDRKIAEIRSKAEEAKKEEEINAAKAKAFEANKGVYVTERELKEGKGKIANAGENLEEYRARLQERAAASKTTGKIDIKDSEITMLKELRRNKESTEEFFGDKSQFVKERKEKLKEYNTQLADSEVDLQAGPMQIETLQTRRKTDQAELAKAEAKQKAEIAAEQRRIDRQYLQSKLETAAPGEAKGLQQKITNLDIEDLKNAAVDNKPKKAVLGQDILLKQWENEKKLQDKLGPGFERLKSAEDEAQQQALEARGAGAILSKNPRNKASAKTYEREKKEADDAQKKLEEVIKQLALGNQDTLASILEFLQQAEAKNKQIKDTIRRLPL